MSASFISHNLFPRARLYALPSGTTGRRVRESRGAYPVTDFSERHLQCVWSDARWRPEKLVTHEGEEAWVENPGVWNLEAGPDFLGAVLRIGPDRRRIAGDVEIHLRPTDWNRHGHGSDPRYKGVKAHVTYFPGALDAGTLPPGTLQISLKDRLLADPRFSFDNLDVLAYPTAARAAPPPCRTVLAGAPPDLREQLMEAAGEERLRRKAERLAEAIDEKGDDQVLYEEIMAALGYKHNKAAFRRLALLVPLRILRETAGTDTLKAYAILLGVAGLLPSDVRRRWDTETRTFIRSLWDAWWKLKDAVTPESLPRAAWRMDGLRPANHPSRRLMAAAEIFTTPEPLSEQIAEALDEQERLPVILEELLDVDTGLYWRKRLSLSGEALKEPVALLGSERSRAILINVLVPYLAARHGGRLAPGWLDNLPAEGLNRVIRQTADNLFGSDHSVTLYRSGLRRQGLIQIFHDYCLNDRSRCAACALPGLIEKQLVVS